jgi:hypothetical protein
MTLETFDHAYPVKITLVSGVDMSGGGVAKIEGTKPNGTAFAWDAVIEDASSGTVYYTTAEDILDAVGTWHIQVVWYPTGSNDGVPGEVVKMQVTRRLKAVAV